MNNYDFIYHNYIGEVLNLEESGGIVLFNNYHFNIFNLLNNNINLCRNIKESLNLRIELIFENSTENIKNDLFCQFVCQKLTAKIELTDATVREIIIDLPSKHCIFPLKKTKKEFYAIINTQNINLALNDSGKYLCYFIIVVRSEYQKKKEIIPLFKYVLNKNLKKIISNKIIIKINK